MRLPKGEDRRVLVKGDTDRRGIREGAEAGMNDENSPVPEGVKGVAMAICRRGAIVLNFILLS